MPEQPEPPRPAAAVSAATSGRSARAHVQPPTVPVPQPVPHCFRLSSFRLSAFELEGIHMEHFGPEKRRGFKMGSDLLEDVSD